MGKPSEGDLVDTTGIVEVKPTVLARRQAEARSATFRASLGLRGRQSARAAVTGKPRRGSEYMYRRVWVDFALFLKFRLGDGTIEQWLNDDRTYRAAETEALLTYLDLHVADVTLEDLEDYRAHLLNKVIIDRKGKRKVGLAQTTVNMRFSAVSRVLDHARKMGLRPDNPADDVGREKKPPTPFKQQPLSARQVRQILDSISRSSPIGKRDHMLLTLLARLGIRREEAAGIVVDDFEDAPGDEEGWTLTIRGKGDKVRVLFVPRDLEMAIKSYVEGLELTGPLFPVVRKGGKVECGMPLHPEDVTRIIKSRSDEGLGRKGCAPHALRATFATRYDDLGGSREHLQQDLGHADARTTQGYITSRLTRKRSATDVVHYNEEHES